MQEGKIEKEKKIRKTIDLLESKSYNQPKLISCMVGLYFSNPTILNLELKEKSVETDTGCR